MSVMAVKLDGLPKELIAHIAIFTDPTAILRLSTTCHAIRAACWDPLILKAILIESQSSHWEGQSLDIEAIVSRAEDDTSTLAKYCIADERARRLLNDPDHFHSPKKFISYAPELLVVKHPLMKEQCWKDALRYRLDQNPSQIFCIAMTILASNELMPSLMKSLKMEGNWNLTDNTSPTGFLWGFCMIALVVRAGVRTRLAAWPFNHAAQVPHIQIPTADQIPLRPISDRYHIPAPFSRRSIELLGKSTSSFSAWDSWYQLHNGELFRSTKCLTDGGWIGYYIDFGNDPLAPLNPPMVDIQFEILEPTATGAVSAPELWTIRAKNCVDGVDIFDLEGAVSCSDYGVRLDLRKNYLNRAQAWDWDCRLTPFGIVGYWGLRQTGRGILRRDGVVWLWRKSWTDTQ